MDEEFKTTEGDLIEVFNFSYEEDEEVLAAWSKHFREHYCLDEEIDLLREGTSLTRAEYLEAFKFPTISGGSGPATRSGDFCEILIADYLEFVLGYWVPRTRYDLKTIRNESTKGSDTLGFKIHGEIDSIEDTLAIFEVKAQLSQRKGTINSRLQDAVNDSSKDILLRKAESLNAIKQHLIRDRNYASVGRVSRFQNPDDRPYTDLSGAAALFDESKFNIDIIKETNTNEHQNKANLKLLVIKAHNFMDLVNKLYTRCMDEA